MRRGLPSLSEPHRDNGRERALRNDAGDRTTSWREPEAGPLNGSVHKPRPIADAGVLLERQRIARNLHDTVCQELAGLALFADRLQRRVEQGEPDTSADASELAAGIRGVLEQVRGAVHGLAPTGDGQGLASALLELSRNIESRFAIPCVARCECDVGEAWLAGELYFIASECASNAARHAGTPCIEIRLLRRDGLVVLEVEDRGCGLEAGKERPGRGLPGMKERARALGARLKITSSPGGGTRIGCEVSEHVIREFNRQGSRESAPVVLASDPG